jgi:hypothetical protein
MSSTDSNLRKEFIRLTSINDNVSNSNNHTYSSRCAIYFSDTTNSGNNPEIGNVYIEDFYIIKGAYSAVAFVDNYNKGVLFKDIEINGITSNDDFELLIAIPNNEINFENYKLRNIRVKNNDVSVSGLSNVLRRNIGKVHTNEGKTSYVGYQLQSFNFKGEEYCFKNVENNNISFYVKTSEGCYINYNGTKVTHIDLMYTGSTLKVKGDGNGNWNVDEIFNINKDIDVSLIDNLLDRNTSYSAYNYTKKIPIWWNGAKWVNALGDDMGFSRNGLFDDKPELPKVGFAYFCTDRKTPEGMTNGIMIYHKGNNVWVDALGRVVE